MTSEEIRRRLRDAREAVKLSEAAGGNEQEHRMLREAVSELIEVASALHRDLQRVQDRRG